MEDSELAIRKKVHTILHTAKHLESNRKTITRSMQDELDSLMSQVSKDPPTTIILKASTVESIKDFSITLKGEGSGISYDATVTQCIKLAESALAHGLGK